MKYAVVILAFFAVQGIRCENCTRTNRQPKVCSKPCDPAQDDCKSNRDCLCDGDCGYSCVKRDLHCPRLSIENGRVRYKNRTLGSVARYRCTSPYKAVGSKKRTCRGNGQWDGEKPTCKLICADPGNIQHGTNSHDGFESGKEVKYRCLPGFTMEGSNTLTCTRTGVWDRVKPSCTCKRTNKQAFRYCRKSCNPASSSCSKDKECVCDGDCGYSCLPKAIDCGKPTVLDNGRRQYSSTTFGSTVSYQCDKPYSLLGSKKRTCRGIRKWDGTEPSCKIICQDPGGITYGNKQIFRRNVDEDYIAVGDRAEYNCFPGYNMEGSKYLTCTNSGEWNRAKPKCVLPSCGPPDLPRNSELRVPKSKKSSYKYSDKVFLKCKSGYFSSTGGMGILNCDLQGWTGLSFTCLPKTCGNPGTPVNGKRNSYIFTFKSRVDFECNRGYKLVGDKYMICQANQRWSGNLPTCEQIDCGVLPVPDKAEKIHETHTKVGGVVRFKCKEKGYEITGSEIRTCGNNGLWSGSPASCDLITCGDPGTPLNGQQADVKNGYNYGGSVKFTCKDNYTLSGSSEIFCEETKDWSSPTPKCWASCPDPGVPGNGRRSGADFRHAKSVTFSCKEDYELEGDATIRCNNGDWTSTTPHCKVPSCKDPGSPLHGRQSKVSKNFTVGGFVRFKCSENYTMVGKGKLTCLEGKMWNGEIPKCFASCPDPGHPENGQTIGRVFDHNSVVEFECLGDRLLQGSSQAKCNNGQWDQALPTCRDCGTGLPLGMESRKIPDTAIKASTHKAQHPAHHGRLGGDNYWCSKERKADFIEIHFAKKYKITGARIQLQSKYTKIKSIILKGQILKQWLNFQYEKPLYIEEVEQIKAKHPFIAQSVRIRVLKEDPESVCLRAEVYGCEIPRGCIMRGSAVLIKQNDKYHRGYVGEYIYTKTNSVEVLLPGKVDTIIMSRADVVQDGKPDVHELAIGKLVLGEDVTTPGLIRKGKIEQITDLVCTIKTNDETWKSDLNDIRIVKISPFCS